jgi:Ca2+:H+ antiporter
VILTLVFPSFTTSIRGPFYSKAQLFFVAGACLTIYAFFLIAQTSRHRNYFLANGEVVKEKAAHPVKISKSVLFLSLFFLLASLGIVVLLAKKLSPTIEQIVVANQLPKALVGVIIAGVILLPEGAAAVIAARKNQLQTSINLALGSALASIALTIPAVAITCSLLDMDVALGLDIKSMILLALSVFIVMLSLASGRTNIVYGVVLLVNLLAFIFLIIFP